MPQQQTMTLAERQTELQRRAFQEAISRSETWAEEEARWAEERRRFRLDQDPVIVDRLG